MLRSVADVLRRRREAQEAAADLGTRVALNAAKNERARELRKAEVRGGGLTVDDYSLLCRVWYSRLNKCQITCRQFSPDLLWGDCAAALYDSSAWL